MFSLRMVTMGVMVCVSAAGFARAEDAASIDDNPVALSQEIKAFHTLTEMEATVEQMKAMKEAAKDAADPHPTAAPAKISEKHLEALKALREALAKPISETATEDERQAHDEAISEAEDALSELTGEGGAATGEDIDDHIETTATARAKAPAIVARLSPTQILTHFGNSEEGGPDPAQYLDDTLDTLRETEAKDVDTIVKDAADRAGMLLTGLEPEKSADLRKQISDILVGSKALSDDDFEKQKPELKKTLAKLSEGIDPFVILRHAMEHDIAEMLSNPRLTAALDARLK